MARTTVLRGLLIAIAAGTLAVSTAVAAGPVNYAGTVRIDNSNDGKVDPVPMQVSMTIDAHRITDYQFFASLRCTDGGYSNVGVIFSQLSHAPIPFSGRRFSVTVGSPSTGIGLTAVIKGTLESGHRLAGSIAVNASEDSGVAPSGPACSSSYHWRMRSQQPVTPPSPPAAAGPSVALTLIAVRKPLTLASYEYGIAVGNVQCTGGAVAFTVTAAGHSATLTCATTTPRPVTNAFFGLAAGSTYELTVQPLAHGASGLVAKGSPLRRAVTIPAAGSPDWKPISGA